MNTARAVQAHVEATSAGTAITGRELNDHVRTSLKGLSRLELLCSSCSLLCAVSVPGNGPVLLDVWQRTCGGGGVLERQAAAYINVA